MDQPAHQPVACQAPPRRWLLLYAALLLGCSDDAAAPDAAPPDLAVDQRPGEGLVFPDTVAPPPDLAPDAAPRCGDGVRNQPSEQCDGTDFGDTSCASLGFAQGTPGCTNKCMATAAGCTSEGMVPVAAGVFVMGSPNSEPCRNSDETQHQVTLTHGFEMGAKELSQGEFQAIMKYNPAEHASCGASCPVENVSWHEAAAYCRALSYERGLTPCYACSGSGASVTCEVTSAYTDDKIYSCPGYRLPTEAEWEYAYRATSLSALYNGALGTCHGLDSNAAAIGWYAENASGPQQGGIKLPNSWKLHDMAGNVWEWVGDLYTADLGALGSTVSDPWGPATGSVRVVRGGSYAEKEFVFPMNKPTTRYLRAAARKSRDPASRAGHTGFRVVRTMLVP